MASTFDDSALELARLRGALEEWRRYLAGPCTQQCIDLEQIESLDEAYNGHKHYTEEYEDVRSSVIALNYILEGDYSWPVMLNDIAARHTVTELESAAGLHIYRIDEEEL